MSEAPLVTSASGVTGSARSEAGLRIERYTSERTRRRDEAIARIIAEDAELLDRLGR